MPKIIDISLPIYPGMLTYPGNEPATIETMPSASGTNVLSKITLSSHTGTHIDAPSHSIPNSDSIDKYPIEKFYGECRVIDLTSVKTGITPSELEGNEIKTGERVLFKTKNSIRGFDSFYDDYVFMTAEGAQYLAEIEVGLVGIDFIAIKQKGNPDNTPHTALLSKNIPILEGINLAKVEEGKYILCAFPLSFKGIDGSPVRAILIKDN